MRLRRRRYHEGGGIPPHEHLADGSHPDLLGPTDDTSEDFNILGSLIQDPLVSESTQPSGYTEPLDLSTPQITLIPEKELTFEEELAEQSKRLERIKELQLLEYFQSLIDGPLTDSSGMPISRISSPELINLMAEEEAYQKKKNEEYEAQHGVIDARLNYPNISPDVRWMFPQGMSMDDINKYVYENPLSNPLGMLAIAEIMSLAGAVSPVVIPGTAHIGGGVTVGNVMNAYFLKEGLQGLVEHVPEFINDPTFGGAADIAIDALMAYPGMSALKRNVLDPFSKAFKEAKLAGDAVGMKNAVDDLGYNYSIWSDDAGKFVKAGGQRGEVIGTIPEEFGGANVIRYPGGQQQGALGQLAASDASASAAASASAPVLQNLAKDHQKDRPRTKKGGYVAEDAGEVYLESNVATTGSSTDTGDFDAVPGVVQNVENPGVYQFSLFVEGGPLEKSVRAKDGTIAISEIEKAANNLPKRSINEKNAILEALDDTRQVKANPNFDPNKPVDPNTNPEYLPVDRIDYETFRSYLSSTIQPAEVVVTKDQANYGVDELGYTVDGDNFDVITNTYVYKDPELGLGKRHGGIEKSSYWVRTADEVENPTVRLITEIQTNNEDLKGSKPLKQRIKQIESALRNFPDRQEFTGLKINTIFSLAPSSRGEVIEYLEGLKNQLKINNANSENLAVKQLNEIFLQAARDGKEVVMFPTVQTSMKIQQHTQGMIFYRASADMSIGAQTNPNTNEIKLFNYTDTELRNSLFEVNKKGNYVLPREDFGLIRLALRPDIQKLFRINPSNYERIFDAKKLREKSAEERAYDEALSVVTSMYRNGHMQQYNPGDIFHKDFLTSDGFKALSEETQKALTEVHEALYKTLDYDVSSFPRIYRNVHSKYDELMSKFKNEFNMDFQITVDSKGNSVYKVDVPEKYFNQDLENPSEFKTYKKGGILQAMAKKNRPDKNKFVSKKVRILRREGKGLRQAVAIALDMYEKKKQEKKFQEGGLFQRLKDRREKIKAAKEYYKEEAENPTMYLNEEGKIMMPGVAYDTGEPVYYEEELTPRQYKRFNRAQFRDYKRGLRRADREARQQERQERRDERIKERGYRRVGRADILPFDVEDILDQLAGENSAGYYLGPKMLGRLTSRRFRDKVGNVSLNQISDNTEKISSVEKGADDSVLDHELIHKSQYGPLQLLASYIGLPGAGRIQDKATRKAFKNLMKSIRKNDTVLDEKGIGTQGNYMVGDKSRDIEFDAILKSGLSSASVAGYDLEGKSFDEIVSILAQAEKDGNISTNMGHLSRFMTGTNWNDEQKGFIMDAIKANLGREAFTAEDARQDLR